MKRTDLEKKERELKKQQKKINKIESFRSNENEEFTESGAINKLFSLFQFDDEEIININHSDELLEFIMLLDETFEEKQLENVFRKAIKKTKISEKQSALTQLKSLIV